MNAVKVLQLKYPVGVLEIFELLAVGECVSTLMLPILLLPVPKT